MNNDGISNLENLIDDYDLSKKYSDTVVNIESGKCKLYEVENVSEAFDKITFMDVKKYILDNKLLTKDQVVEAEQIGKNKGKLEVLKSKKDGEV